MKIIQEPIAEASGRFLDYLSARQKVIAANLANIDTPGYRVKDLTFQQELFSSLNGQEMPGRPSPGPADFVLAETEGLPSKMDGNNVSLDREMTAMAETSVQYSMMVQMMQLKFRILQLAAREGK